MFISCYNVYNQALWILIMSFHALQFQYMLILFTFSIRHSFLCIFFICFALTQVLTPAISDGLGILNMSVVRIYPLWEGPRTRDFE